MLGDAETDVARDVVEVDANDDELVGCGTQEGILAVGVEGGRMGVDVHEVEELAFDDGGLSQAEVEEAGVGLG